RRTRTRTPETKSSLLHCFSVPYFGALVLPYFLVLIHPYFCEDSPYLPPPPRGAAFAGGAGLVSGCGFFTYLSSHAAQRAQRSSSVSRAAGPWSSFGYR